MTERELDRTKSELVRALRRRAAELDAQEGELRLGAPGARPGPAGARRAVRQPNGRRAHQVAFFARQTFQLGVGAPTGAAAVGANGNLF